MKLKINVRKPEAGGDVVLQEMWRIKDTLSASYGHDIQRLFEETRKREKLSAHPLVDPPPQGDPQQ